MGTFIRYIIYFLIIIALYIVGKGLYTGSITSSTTVGSVATQIDDGARNMAKNAVEVVSDAADEAMQNR